MPVSAYLTAGLFVVAEAAALFAAAGTVAIPGFWAYLAIFAVVIIVAIPIAGPGVAWLDNSKTAQQLVCQHHIPHYEFPRAARIAR
jgi:hypothetical protein